MLLVFRLGRPDVLAVDDYGLRKGLGAVVAGGTPAGGALPGRDDLRRAGERWRPYRSAASWYLWRAAERPEVAAPARRRTRPAAPTAGRPVAAGTVRHRADAS